MPFPYTFPITLPEASTAPFSCTTHEMLHVLDGCYPWRGIEHRGWEAADFGGIETAITDAGAFISGSGP